MYCQACGSEVRNGLKYCNRCGANQFAEKVAPPHLFAVILAMTGAIVAVVVCYLLLLSIFASEILRRDNVSAEVYVFLMLFTCAVFGIEALLIRQLSRLLSVYLQTGSEPPQRTTREMPINQSAEGLLEPERTPAHAVQTRPIVSFDTDDFVGTATAPQETETRRLETDE